MKCLAVFIVLLGLSLALPIEKQNAEANEFNLDELLSILQSNTAKAQLTGTVDAQEELAQAQIGLLAATLLGAVVSGVVGAGVSEGLSQIPLQEQVKEQGLIEDADKLLSLIDEADLIKLLDNLGPKTAKAQKLPSFLRPFVRPVIDKGISYVGDALSNYLGGDGQATAQGNKLSPEAFFRLCCQIAMSLSEGEELSMMELCRRCCEVAQGLLDAGEGMSSDQFYKFCCSVAKEMMGQNPPTEAAKAQRDFSKLLDLMRDR